MPTSYKRPAAIVALLVGAVVLVIAIRVAIAIDWSFEAARTGGGMAAVAVSYFDFVFVRSAHPKPWPFVIEVRRDMDSFHVAYLPRDLHLGGAVEYEISRRSFRILARRFTE